MLVVLPSPAEAGKVGEGVGGEKGCMMPKDCRSAMGEWGREEGSGFGVLSGGEKWQEGTMRGDERSRLTAMWWLVESGGAVGEEVGLGWDGARDETASDAMETFERICGVGGMVGDKSRLEATHGWEGISGAGALLSV